MPFLLRNTNLNKGYVRFVIKNIYKLAEIIYNKTTNHFNGLLYLRERIKAAQMTYNERLKEYLTAIKNGDETKFNEFVTFTYGLFLNVAKMYLFDKTEAESVMSDVYLKIYLYADRFDASKNAKAYIWEIVKNKAIDYNQQRYKHQAVNLEDIPTVDNVDHFERAITRADLINALKKVDKQNAWIFVWVYIQGHTQDEVAQKLNISKSAVSQRLSKTKKKLSEYLK